MTEWVPRRGPTLRRPAGFLCHATGVPTVRHRALLGALKDGADRSGLAITTAKGDPLGKRRLPRGFSLVSSGCVGWFWGGPGVGSGTTQGTAGQAKREP
jgi:hypothetical protein